MSSTPGTSPTPTPPPSSLMLLVHRPGRMIALATAGTFIVIGALLLAFQWSAAAGRPWLNFVLIVPIVVGFLAIMRTGTTRCEIELGSERLLLRSMDSSQLLGRTREALYLWSDVRNAHWVGEDQDELRIDFARAPRALVFSGAKRDLETLKETLTSRGNQ